LPFDLFLLSMRVSLLLAATAVVFAHRDDDGDVRRRV
jgi:hypothetical protein